MITNNSYLNRQYIYFLLSIKMYCIINRKNCLFCTFAYFFIFIYILSFNIFCFTSNFAVTAKTRDCGSNIHPLDQERLWIQIPPGLTWIMPVFNSNYIVHIFEFIEMPGLRSTRNVLKPIVNALSAKLKFLPLHHEHCSL